MSDARAVNRATGDRLTSEKERQHKVTVFEGCFAAYPFTFHDTRSLGHINKGCIIPNAVKFCEWDEFCQYVPAEHRDLKDGLPIDQAHQFAINRGFMREGSTLSDFIESYRAACIDCKDPF
jgi:hypothetical protein